MQLSIEIDELFLSGNSCKSCGNSSVGSLCSHCQKICFHVKNNEVSSSILLTQVEKMPIMSVYRLPQGQYGYNWHVVNLPQDVASFVQSLPHLPSELDVIVVRKEGANQSHRDFRVSDVQWCTELSSGWSHTTSTTTLSQLTCINPVLL